LFCFRTQFETPLSPLSLQVIEEESPMSVVIPFLLFHPPLFARLREQMVLLSAVQFSTPARQLFSDQNLGTEWVVRFFFSVHSAEGSCDFFPATLPSCFSLYIPFFSCVWLSDATPLKGYG